MKQWIVLAAVLGVVDPSCTLKDICPHENLVTRRRPPTSYTNALKVKQMKALGMTGDPNTVELDHEIPICLCGSTTDPNNLTPELWPQARIKDKYEASFHRAVCSGKMTLEEAQRQIVTFE